MKNVSIFKSNPNLLSGLTTQEVNQRIKENKVNKYKDKTKRSYLNIIFRNLLNPFNLILFIIALIFLGFVIYLNASGNSEIANKTFGISKFGFMIPVVLNTLVSIFQEIRTQHILNKLKIVTETKTYVIRNKKERYLKADEIVLDDVIHLKNGNQVVVDIKLVDGYCEVDESIITGESNLIQKNPGDTIYAGSSIISGDGYGLVIKVGNDTYAANLTKKAKLLNEHKSDLLTSINNLMKILSIILLVMAVVISLTLCYKINKWGNDLSVFSTPQSLKSAETLSTIIITVGSFSIGVIPTGLILISTATLAVSIYKLAKQHTLTQELYSLENLSRINTICLDKTGTLTDGSIKLIKTDYFAKKDVVVTHIQHFLYAHSNYNASTQAIFNIFGSKPTNLKEIVPFSSTQKYSSIIYPNGDNLTLGAPEYLLNKDNEELKKINEYMKEGKRVMVLTLNKELIATFIFEDNLRKDADETIQFFYKNNIDVKIISGDNPLTILAIAKKSNIKNYDKVISLENVPLTEIPNIVNKYTIFARTNPEQKLAIVKALQENNKKVAMLGDGVNDILALKKSDAAITFANATDASKASADVILLNNNFSNLKNVFYQGRQVVNNVERTAILFLMKTFAIISLSLLLIPFKKGQMNFNIENIYMMQTSVTTVGGFLLSLEHNNNPHNGSFYKNVLPKALIASVLLTISVLTPVALNTWSNKQIISDVNVSALTSILTTVAGLVVIISLAYPFNKYRSITLIVVILTAILLGLAFPTSFIGGEVSTFSMFTSETGKFVDSQIYQEFFKPQNSTVIKNMYNQLSTYLVPLIFFVIFTPIYLFLFNYKKIKNTKENTFTDNTF